jgi:hypothetical protein
MRSFLITKARIGSEPGKSSSTLVVSSMTRPTRKMKATQASSRKEARANNTKSTIRSSWRAKQKL